MSKGRVCLAYSGGLDTSVILAWLIEQKYEVVAYLANVGQEEDWNAIRVKALKVGAIKMVIVDLRREFIDKYLYTAVKCHAMYEGRYLLGTSLARAPMAKAQMQVALDEKCDFVSHGATGKGNDGPRMEMAYLAISPSIKIIAPWRMPEFFNRFRGRSDLIDYAEAQGIAITSTKAKPYSMDENISHTSYEAGMLEDPNTSPPDDMWRQTVSPLDAPNKSEDINLVFKEGLPIELSVEGKKMTDSLEIFTELNRLGKKHGIGRIDIVEQRFIGLKSRGCYDAPAMTILYAAHLDLECLCLDGRVISLRNQFVSHTWSELLYNGLYFSPEREFIEGPLHACQKHVNGEVRLRLYKAHVTVLGRKSDTERLYSEEDASMDQLDTFSPVDTSGFIATQAIRLKKYGEQKKADGEPLSK